MKRVSLSDIRNAVLVLKRGGVIALPTETTYGLACDPRSAKAVKKIFQIKGRIESKPLQLIAGSFAQVSKLARMTTEEKCLGKKYWPGPLTLLVRMKKGKRLAKKVSPKNVIGIRVTSSKIAKAVADGFGHPIAATSANRSGSKPAYSGVGVCMAFHTFPHKPDFVLDAGPLPKNRPSTVARVKKDGVVEVLRKGAIPLAFPLLRGGKMEQKHKRVLPSKKGRLEGI